MHVLVFQKERKNCTNLDTHKKGLFQLDGQKQQKIKFICCTQRHFLLLQTNKQDNFYFYENFTLSSKHNLFHLKVLHKSSLKQESSRRWYKPIDIQKLQYMAYGYYLDSRYFSSCKWARLNSCFSYALLKSTEIEHIQNF